MSTREIGNLGEGIAEKYLKNKGYQILDKNYSFRLPGSPKKGEIDIVAKKGDIISFIEVKSLGVRHKSGPAILPEEKVDFAKGRKLRETAESWLLEKKISPESKWQIDIISIKIDFDNKKAKISHFKNAIF